MATLPGERSSNLPSYNPAPVEEVEKGELEPVLTQEPQLATRPETTLGLNQEEEQEAGAWDALVKPAEQQKEDPYGGWKERARQLDPNLDDYYKRIEALPPEDYVTQTPAPMKRVMSAVEGQAAQKRDQQSKDRTTKQFSGITAEAEDAEHQAYLRATFKAADGETLRAIEEPESENSVFGNVIQGMPGALYQSGLKLKQMYNVARGAMGERGMREIDMLLRELPEGGTDPYYGMTREQLERRRDALFAATMAEYKVAVETIVSGQKIKMPKDVERFWQATASGDVNQWFSAFMKAPASIFILGTAQMLGDMVPGMAGAAAGSLAAGPVGTVAGAFVGSTGGAYLTQIMEALRKKGVDVTDVKALDAAFRDREFMQDIHETAMAYGVGIGAFDAASFGIAGKMLVPAKMLAGRLIGRELVNVGAQGVAQAGLGMGGEIAGTLAAYGYDDLSATEVLTEGLFEFATAPADIATVRGSARARAKREQEKLKARLENRKRGVEPNEEIQDKEAATEEAPPPEPATETGELDDSVLDAERMEAEKIRQEMMADGTLEPEEAAPPQENTAEALKEEVREQEDIETEVEAVAEEVLADSLEQAIGEDASPRDLVLETINREEKDRVAFTKFESEARKAGDLDLAGMEVDVRYTGEDGEAGVERMSAKDAISLVNTRMKGITQLARCLG